MRLIVRLFGYLTKCPYCGAPLNKADNGVCWNCDMGEDDG